MISPTATMDIADQPTDAPPKPPRATDDRPLVDEVVLLGGSVRSTELRQLLDRSPMDLPLAPKWTLLDGWREHCASLARACDRDLPVSVLIDDGTAAPTVHNTTECVDMRVIRDPHPYRGTGGVLRDVMGGGDPNRMLLVASAMQVLTRPLIALVRTLVHLGADVALTAHDDGSPAGLMLMRAKVLEHVPEVGFFDLKEQGLPVIAEHHSVRVARLSHPATLPVRRRTDYIAGLAALHGRADDLPFSGTAMAERWRPSFALVEDGADVHPSAKLHDSVVLRGAVIEAGSLIVRSVVGPGAPVTGRAVIDQTYPQSKERT